MSERQWRVRILREAGIGSPRKRRAPSRQRRERKAQAGQMILWHGSEHEWLEGRGPRLCLMGAIDDATGELLPVAHFTEQESTVGYLRVLRDILIAKGIPHTVYGDRHSSLRALRSHSGAGSVRAALRAEGLQETTPFASTVV